MKPIITLLALCLLAGCTTFSHRSRTGADGSKERSTSYTSIRDDAAQRMGSMVSDGLGWAAENPLVSAAASVLGLGGAVGWFNRRAGKKADAAWDEADQKRKEQADKERELLLTVLAAKGPKP